MKVIIVGAGISGLATAHALRTRDPGLELLVLEASNRVGGKVWTERSQQGYVCEWGVNGFLDNKPRTLDLSRALGLDPLAGAADAARRYVYRDRRLHLLPQSPPAFLTSRLLSLPGRLRVMLEPLIPRGTAADESLANFARRRLGEEALKALIDPMASGVFAGDPEQLSLKSCFPRIHEIESQYGSLIRGMVRLQRESRRAGRGPGPGPGPGGKLTSFRRGMGKLTDQLAAELDPDVKTGMPVQSISRTGNRYEVHLEDGGCHEADTLVLAAPAWAQAHVLRDLAPDIADMLGTIPYPPLAVVCMGYRLDQLQKPPDGFGFLVPSSEQRKLLGTIFDSNVFPDRAPEGCVLMRSMIGGSRSPQLALQDEQVLLDMVRAEFQSVLGIRAEPEFAQAYIHKRAIPQYHVGHADRLRELEAALQAHPGLILTGNAFRGVSLNDCVINAQRVAREILAEESGTNTTIEMDGHVESP